MVKGGFCVDPERFELSSKHGTNYAFYMLICHLIVGKGKAGRLPVPSSLCALSRSVFAPLTKPVLLIDAPYADITEQNTSGTKAMLILN